MEHIFNENFVEKRCLWVSWTVHMTHWIVIKSSAHSQKKKKKKKKGNAERQTPKRKIPKPIQTLI